jgi:hypothetical protein
MFSVCANPDCQKPFNYRQGRLFRFHKDYFAGGQSANVHSVQHFWLCGACSTMYTLEYQNDRGVLIKSLPMTTMDKATIRFIAAA